MRKRVQTIYLISIHQEDEIRWFGAIAKQFLEVSAKKGRQLLIKVGESPPKEITNLEDLRVFISHIRVLSRPALKEGKQVKISVFFCKQE